MPAWCDANQLIQLQAQKCRTASCGGVVYENCKSIKLWLRNQMMLFYDRMKALSTFISWHMRLPYTA